MPPKPPSPYSVHPLTAGDIALLRFAKLDPNDYTVVEAMASAPPQPQAIGDMGIGDNPTRIPILAGLLPFFVPYGHHASRILDASGKVNVDVIGTFPVPPLIRTIMRKSDLPEQVRSEVDDMETAIAALPALPPLRSLIGGGSTPGGNGAADA